MEQIQEWHREAFIAGRFGISRDEIREFRKRFLTEGIHYQLGAGRHLMLSTAGVVLLIEKTNLPVIDTTPPKRVHTAPPPLPRIGDWVQLKVHQVPSKRNRRLLFAYQPGRDPRNHDNLITVRIHPSAAERFTVGMAFEARCEGIKYCVCQRKPRRKNRW